jgi:DMSO/TMAO reductase YedYZ molybdopterin-dependent catalytic subunit
METPDGDYYCGFDLRVCQHPVSTLVTEMSGKPLGQWHGAPIRLHMPIK